MKRLSLAVVCIALLAFSSSSYAAGYGAAGCGIGSLAFGADKNSKMNQIFAATINDLIIPKTSSISTGTSNCGESGLVLAEKEEEIFVEKNFDNLAKEMAAGEGENINTLASLLGCNDEGTSRFGGFTKSNYDSFFSGDATSPSQFLKSIKTSIGQDSDLSVSCNNISI